MVGTLVVPPAPRCWHSNALASCQVIRIRRVNCPLLSHRLPGSGFEVAQREGQGSLDQSRDLQPPIPFVDREA